MPPTINLDHPDVEAGCDLDYVPNVGRKLAGGGRGLGLPRLRRAQRRHRVQAASMSAVDVALGPADAEAMDEILGFLPHRTPFLFADRVEIEGERILGYRLFRPEEDFFKGHFPGYPVVPGVILLESMFQCGGRRRAQDGHRRRWAPSSSPRSRKPASAGRSGPGETFRAEIENLKATPRIVHQRGAGYVGDEIAVEAEWISIAGGNE